MTEINSLDLEKVLKYYNSVKKASEKYCHSDKGKERRRAASANYYQKMKLIDPEFLRKNSEKAKERYHRTIDSIVQLTIIISHFDSERRVLYSRWCTDSLVP